MAAGRETDGRRDGGAADANKNEAQLVWSRVWSVEREEMQDGVVGWFTGRSSHAIRCGSRWLNWALFGCLCGWCPHRHGQGVVRCVDRVV